MLQFIFLGQIGEYSGTNDLLANWVQDSRYSTTRAGIFRKEPAGTLRSITNASTKGETIMRNVLREIRIYHVVAYALSLALVVYPGKARAGFVYAYAKDDFNLLSLSAGVSNIASF